MADKQFEDMMRKKVEIDRLVTENFGVMDGALTIGGLAAGELALAAD